MGRDRRGSAGDWDLVSEACRILSSSSSIKCSVYLIQLLIRNCSPEHRFFYLYVNAPLCSVLGHILHLLCLSLERGLNNSLIFWNRHVFCRSHWAREQWVSPCQLSAASEWWGDSSGGRHGDLVTYGGRKKCDGAVWNLISLLSLNRAHHLLWFFFTLCVFIGF